MEGRRIFQATDRRTNALPYPISTALISIGDRSTAPIPSLTCWALPIVATAITTSIATTVAPIQ